VEANPAICLCIQHVIAGLYESCHFKFVQGSIQIVLDVCCAKM